MNFIFLPDDVKQSIETLLTKTQWDYLKTKKSQLANGYCHCCGIKTDPNNLNLLNEYDIDENCQSITLKSLKSVCGMCHKAYNFDLHLNEKTELLGYITLITGWDFEETQKEIVKALEQKEQWEKVDWTTNANKIRFWLKSKGIK